MMPFIHLSSTLPRINDETDNLLQFVNITVMFHPVLATFVVSKETKKDDIKVSLFIFLLLLTPTVGIHKTAYLHGYHVFHRNA